MYNTEAKNNFNFFKIVSISELAFKTVFTYAFKPCLDILDSLAPPLITAILKDMCSVLFFFIMLAKFSSVQAQIPSSNPTTVIASFTDNNDTLVQLSAMSYVSSDLAEFIRKFNLPHFISNVVKTVGLTYFNTTELANSTMLPQECFGMPDYNNVYWEGEFSVSYNGNSTYAQMVDKLVKAICSPEPMPLYEFIIYAVIFMAVSFCCIGIANKCMANAENNARPQSEHSPLL